MRLLPQSLNDTKRKQIADWHAKKHNCLSFYCWRHRRERSTLPNGFAQDDMIFSHQLIIIAFEYPLSS